jgi:hypothetical protein
MLETYGLHNILQRIQPDIPRRRLDLRVHGHCQTLTNRAEDQRPFTSEKRQLHGKQREHGADDAGGIDDDVLLVSVGHGAAAFTDVVAEQDDGEKGACEVEGPVVTLANCISI